MRSILLVLLMCITSAAAAERGIILSIASHHTLAREYNESNPGIGYSHYYDDGDAWQTGFYFNSSSKWSVYTGYKNYFYKSSVLQPSIGYGVVTGYDSAPVLPFITLGLDIKVNKYDKLNIILAPITGDVDGDKEYGVVFGLQFERVWRNR